jgi:hypothetical protein
LRIGGREKTSLTLTNCSRESHHLHASHACAPKRRCARVRGRAGCVDVVDQAYARRRRSGHDHTAANVSAPFGESEAPLTRKRLCARQNVKRRRSPDVLERTRESTWCDVAALPGSFWITRNVSERIDPGPCKDLRDENRCLGRESAAATLLPLADERTSSCVVDDRRPRPREREPAPRAFGTPANRPRPWSPTALANRRNEANECSATDGTQRATGECAYRAPLREEHVECAHTTTVRRKLQRLRANRMSDRRRCEQLAQVVLCAIQVVGCLDREKTSVRPPT